MSLALTWISATVEGTTSTTSGKSSTKHAKLQLQRTSASCQASTDFQSIEEPIVRLSSNAQQRLTKPQVALYNFLSWQPKLMYFELLPIALGSKAAAIIAVLAAQLSPVSSIPLALGGWVVCCRFYTHSLDTRNSSQKNRRTPVTSSASNTILFQSVRDNFGF